MIEQTNNKTIAKNTLFLYFRMIFTMLVSLYTSRVILEVMGVTDYGIYQAVGGIVGFLSFINSALSTGSSRFLTFELGAGDEQKLKKTFSTTLTIHIAIAILIIILAETLGVWFLYHKLVISPNRFDAAIFVFHISVLTAIFTIIQVPFNAIIIAHEKMSIYAYMSIVEVSLKLLIVYLLYIGNFDKLKLYAGLLALVQIIILLFYYVYCIKHFKETKYSFIFDKSIFKSIASFSGWSLFANAAFALNSQGMLILLNMFFAPAIVAARAISIQVNMSINQLVMNFRTAVNPQIVKQFAAGNFEKSKNLLLSSTKYSYYLMLILCIPVCILAEPLLEIWLVEVPDYTVIFLQIVIVQSLFQVFDYSFYMALNAMGRLKENALISPTIGFLVFPIVYILFKFGYSPIALSWVSLIAYTILGLIVKPLLIIKIANYSSKDVHFVFYPCLKVTILSLPIPLFSLLFLDIHSVFGFIFVAIISVASPIIFIYFVGLSSNVRFKIINEIRKRIF